MNIDLFSFADYWWFYLAFTGFVLVMLVLDLGVFHRKAHEVSFREATIWTVVWIGLALVLIFVGLKMAWLNEVFGGKFPIGWSLGIITALIAASVALSLLFPKRKTA